mgnify:CR=1 FL=1
MMSQTQPNSFRRRLTDLVRRLLLADKGNVTIMTTVMIAPMLGVTALAVDYGFAIKAQNALEQIAQNAATVATNGARRVVNSYASPSIPADSSHDSDAISQGQKLGFAAFEEQASKLPNVSSTQAVTVTRSSNTFMATVTFQAQVRTVVMRAFGMSTISISGKGSNIVGIMDEPANNASGNVSFGTDLILHDSWTANSLRVGGISSIPVYNNWFSGTAGTESPWLRSTDIAFNNAPADVTGAIRVGNPTGSMARIISKKLYLQTGIYTVRYWYKSTVVYPEYEPVHICGTEEAEMSWVTSGRTRSLSSAVGSTPTAQDNATVQTARAGVYLNPILSNPQTALDAPTLSSFARPPAMPATSTNKRTDNSSYRIDICAYSSRWIQRNVMIQIKAAGYFWLSFVAEVPTTTTVLNGFYLGPVSICPQSCADVRNNSPWTEYDVATNTPGTLLFSDSFDTPKVNDGDPFDLTSGTFPAAAKYELPISNWIIFDRSTNSILNNGANATTTTDFVYSTTGPDRITPHDGDQMIRANVSTRIIGRRLLLLPGYYRVKRWWAVQATSGGTCSLFTDTRANFDVSRQDLASIYMNPSRAPSNYVAPVNVGAGFQRTGCPTMGYSLTCYLLTQTQLYDIMFGANAVGGSYIDANGVTRPRVPSMDTLTVEFVAPYRGEVTTFPNPGDTCTTTTGVSREAITGGLMWPGSTPKDLGRMFVIAPLP